MTITNDIVIDRKLIEISNNDYKTMYKTVSSSHRRMNLSVRIS